MYAVDIAYRWPSDVKEKVNLKSEGLNKFLFDRPVTNVFAKK